MTPSGSLRFTSSQTNILELFESSSILSTLQILHPTLQVNISPPPLRRAKNELDGTTRMTRRKTIWRWRRGGRGRSSLETVGS